MTTPIHLTDDQYDTLETHLTTYLEEIQTTGTLQTPTTTITLTNATILFGEQNNDLVITVYSDASTPDFTQIKPILTTLINNHTPNTPHETYCDEQQLVYRINKQNL